MLEQHEVAAYLVERRLLSRRTIVSGRLRIADASSRNRNVRVSGGPGESYLLKQGVVADSAETLANEVALYRRLAAAPAPVAACIPHLYGHDALRGVLILEWIEHGLDLYRHHASRDEASPTLAAALARVLATIHGIARDDEELRDDAPWVLSLHRPKLDALRYLSAASIALIGAVQADERVTTGLDELRDGWHSETLVHRDVKWANCIAFDPRGGARATRIKLVDWEMAGWGDPAFDVGSAFNDFLGYCERGQRPLSSAQPAIGAFWRAYVRARALDDRAAAQLLVRAIRFAGARLLQSTFEHTQETPHVTPRVAAGVALSATMLSAPREAAAGVLGIAA